MFMERKTQYWQDVSSPKFYLQIHCDSNINSSKLFFDIDKPILKFTWRNKRPRIVNTRLNQSNLVRLMLPNFKTYYEATVIKRVWYQQKNRQIDQSNRIESPEIDPYKVNLSLTKKQRQYNGEKQSFQQTVLELLDIQMQK